MTSTIGAIGMMCMALVSGGQICMKDNHVSRDMSRTERAVILYCADSVNAEILWLPVCPTSTYRSMGVK